MTTDKDQAYQQGKRRLRDMLGRARAEARKRARSMDAVPQNLLSQSFIETVREKHLDSLMVYEEGQGRWFGDLAFKNLPVGLPTVMGTPVAMPKATREEALSEAYLILVFFLQAIEEQKTTSRDKPSENVRIFELYGFSFKLPVEVIEMSSTIKENLKEFEDYGEQEAKAYLERALSEMCGDSEFTGEIFDAATPELRTRLLTAMTLMLLHGHFRYPERRPLS